MRPPFFRLSAAALGLAAAFLSAGCIEITNDAKYEAPFHYNYDLAPGGRVSLETANGSVEIAGWDENRIDISGTKYASSQALLDRVKIEIHNGSDETDIRTIRPDEFLASVGARYVIRVPRSAIIDQILTRNASIRVRDVASGARLRTTNGSIQAENLKGQFDAQTTNGRISLERISGAVTLRTTNGSIRAENIDSECRAHTTNGTIELSFAQPPGQGIRAETSNGRITVHLPSQTSARLQAHTRNGSISSDLNVNGTVHWDKNDLEGNIGSGGPLIELTTTNGSIRLMRG